MKTNYTNNGLLKKFWESNITTEKSKLDFGARYISSFNNPSFNIYGIGPMLRDVLGFSRKESKDAFLYWLAFNNEFVEFIEGNS